jgi:hypothetical protein
MIGKEAIKYLHAGYTLRRKAWEPDQKCKAYFSDDMWSVKIDINDPILGALDTHLVPQWVPEKPEFSNYVCYYDIIGYMSIFDAIDAGEFLMDDWEIVE